MPPGSTPSRPSSTRTCTCAHPAARTRRTSTPAPAPPPPAASARSSPCRTPTRWWTAPRCCGRCASAPASRRACRSASSPRSRAGMDGEELTEMAELADEGAVGFTDDGLPVRSAGRAAPRAQLPAPGRPRARPARGGPHALGRRRDARGRRLGPARAGRDPLDQRVHDGGARRRDRRSTRTRACTSSTCPRARRSTAIEQAKAAGVKITAEATPHHLTLTDEAVLGARLELQDEPAAALGGRPPGADRGAAQRACSTAWPPTTRRTRARRRSSRSSWRPMGVTGLETAFAARPHRPGAAGRDRARAAGGAHDRGWRRRSGLPIPTLAPGSPANVCSSTSTPSGRWGRRATRAAPPTAASPGARSPGACA